MIRDLDIYRSAIMLVKYHGQDAPIHAAMRADAMLEAGDKGLTEKARNPTESASADRVPEGDAE